MNTITSVKGFPAVGEKVEILGEIVSWYLPPGAEVRYSHLTDALRDSGLDAGVARAFLPRNAFARAVRKLTEQRIIRKVDEDEAAVRFQFTRETNTGDALEYTREAILTLAKETGAITCGDDPALEQRAKDAFDEAMDRRTSSDITAVVQRLFSDRKRPDVDLVPVRKQGGAYFVRKEALGFVDKVGAFLDRLHGELTRLPIAAGYGSGEKVVSVSVAEKISGLIGELDEVVDGFDPDPAKQHARSIAAAGDRVKLIRHKIASYAEYLADQRESLEAALKVSGDRLKAKIFAVSDDEMAAG